MAENADHDVAFGRFGDLLLKGGMSAVELGLPADSLEPRGPGEFAVQPLDDAVHATALMNGIAGRGNKDADVAYPVPLAFDRRIGLQTQLCGGRGWRRSRLGRGVDERGDHGGSSFREFAAKPNNP